MAPRFWLRRIVSCTVARADLRSQSARAARDFVGARHPLKAVQRCAVDEQLEMVIRLLSRCASPGGSSFTNPGVAGNARRCGARHVARARRWARVACLASAAFFGVSVGDSPLRWDRCFPAREADVGARHPSRRLQHGTIPGPPLSRCPCAHSMCFAQRVSARYPASQVERGVVGRGTEQDRMLGRCRLSCVDRVLRCLGGCFAPTGGAGAFPARRRRRGEAPV